MPRLGCNFLAQIPRSPRDRQSQEAIVIRRLRVYLEGAKYRGPSGRALEPSDGVAAGFSSSAPWKGVAASRPGRSRPTGRHEPRSRKDATQPDMAIAQAIAPLDGVPVGCPGFAQTEI